MHSVIIRVVICFEKIILDIIILWKEKRRVLFLEEKITLLLDGRKFKYVHVAHTSSLVIERRQVFNSCNATTK